MVYRDIATTLLRAFAEAHPLCPRGVKEALERVMVDFVAHKHDVEAPVAIVRLGGVTRSAISIDHGALVLADDRGRVEVVELDSGTRRSFRATI